MPLFRAWAWRIATADAKDSLRRNRMTGLLDRVFDATDVMSIHSWLPLCLRLRRALNFSKGKMMKNQIQTLGWWMRRTVGRAMVDVAPFYTEVIGLPLVRAYGDFLILVWAGEDLIFEVKTDDPAHREQSDPATAACIPVLRSHDLAATRARMASFGYHPVTEEMSEWGRTLFYLGPDALIIGFEERSDNSPHQADREALASWRAGPPVLGALPPLPAGLHYLSRVIRRVADVASVASFYRDTMGLEDRGYEGASVIFSLGDAVTLEVAPGGVSQPIPGDREELPDSYILRIHDFDGVMAGLVARGTTFNGELIVWEGTTYLRYLQDPEGHLTGIEERRPNHDYLEDIAAEQRWAARQA